MISAASSQDWSMFPFAQEDLPEPFNLDKKLFLPSPVKDKEPLPPSQDTEIFWHCADSPVVKTLNIFSSESQYCGKWQVFLDMSELDDTWKKVKALTEAGELGLSAKCATARPNPNARELNTKVIIVYTKDYSDLDDVGRVAWLLHHHGIFKGPVLNYKTDDTTRAGQYAYNSSQRVSSYSLGINSFTRNKTQDELISFLKLKYGQSQH